LLYAAGTYLLPLVYDIHFRSEGRRNNTTSLCNATQNSFYDKIGEFPFLIRLRNCVNEAYLIDWLVDYVVEEPKLSVLTFSTLRTRYLVW
jgi:hypothetical protein